MTTILEDIIKFLVYFIGILSMWFISIFSVLSILNLIQQ